MRDNLASVSDKKEHAINVLSVRRLEKTTAPLNERQKDEFSICPCSQVTPDPNGGK
jgi:hypothetical protein